MRHKPLYAGRTLMMMVVTILPPYRQCPRYLNYTNTIYSVYANNLHGTANSIALYLCSRMPVCAKIGSCCPNEPARLIIDLLYDLPASEQRSPKAGHQTCVVAHFYVHNISESTLTRKENEM